MVGVNQSVKINSLELLKDMNQSLILLSIKMYEERKKMIKQALDCLREEGCPSVTLLHCVSEYPANPEDGYGWEKLFSERMCRHFMEDYGIEVRVARYHNIYGPYGTYSLEF